MAAAQVDLDNIEIDGEPKWFYVSESARHGFCPDCGSQIMWRNDKNSFMSLTAGCMDNTEDLEIACHIFCEEKGDYYQIPESESNFSRWDS